MTDFRRTGRTTRMLQEAIKEAKAGGYVFVVGATKDEVSRMRYDLTATPGTTVRVHSRDTIEFPSGGKIVLVPRSDPNLDLNSGRYRGAHSTWKVMVDHYAIEQEMGWLYREWLRWLS